ncbi:hypothetical protein NUU61_002500 [Penicillium alfredii]|uniref:Probable E3 ubiquitin ligase complex SCF subunit sconB n=1 Tax=Penicillium alfredii TaxID=1506179 RepID=A0A9W9FRU6_9EURO|nr:uncharacterized protein NUU61_002500 [Penicillium alfredii]KAJ5105153.1 hypothetical protein NUU61_002500 [Penicillium alfredii]
MPKRCREPWSSDLLSAKRTRKDGSVDHLSCLSDELLLHILSLLPISSLNVCQRLSHRFHALSGDSELWKRQYYSQWVRPQAHRLANLRRTTLSAKTEYSPKVSTWLGHGHLAEAKVTNWKRQYRLRHNWSKGLCRMTQVEFPKPQCPELVKLCAGLVLTADNTYGLRAWTAKDPAACVAKVAFSAESRLSGVAPTALAVSQVLHELEIVVGFDNGCISLYTLDLRTSQLSLRTSYVGSSDGAITAIALSSPYLLMVSQYKILSLYNLRPGSQRAGKAGAAKEPRQIASLRADNIVAPVNLSLRVSPFEIIATIVYSFFHIGCGWSLGIQELRLDKDGQQLGSRLATTVDSQYGTRIIPDPSPEGKRRSAETQNRQNLDNPGVPSILHQHPPTSMAYSHPYLLTSHADNTLTMYLVVSTSGHLFVRGGQRLWGHTSSVSAVQVTNRGKAVSVSSRGDEIRIWELEMAISSLGTRKPLKEENSIQVSPGNQPHTALGLDDMSESICSPNRPDPIPATPPELSRMHSCVGFDDERVLLLREKIGTQLLECYDFT